MAISRAQLRPARVLVGLLLAGLLVLVVAGIVTGQPLEAALAGILFVITAVGAWWLRPGTDPAAEQLRRLQATREDLLATISHEFRTPLTAIQGAALTLRKHGDKLDRQRTDTILDAVIANAERLGRLLENMLTAAEARSPDQHAVADVHRIATDVVATVEAAHPLRTEPIVVAIAPDLEARIEPAALHQILSNLLTNAVIHAQQGSRAIIAAGYDGGDIVVTVANEGQGIDAETLAALFEPFTQQDSSSTRPYEGAGIGLYVVRRLVEVSSGSLNVRSTPGWVSVEVRLPRPAPRTVDLTSAEAPVDLDH